MKILEVVIRICELIGIYMLCFVITIGYGLWQFLKCICFCLKSIFYEMPVFAYNAAFDKIPRHRQTDMEQIEIDIDEDICL